MNYCRVSVYGLGTDVRKGVVVQAEALATATATVAIVLASVE